MSTLSLMFATGLLVAAQGGAEPEMSEIFALRSGEADYGYYCAACHGVDAKGHGPVAPALIRQPSDLTTLAARNEGIFPDDRVFWVIDGRGEVRAHGPREMPVWGREFQRDETGLALNPESEQRVRNLVEYLKAIQE